MTNSVVRSLICALICALSLACSAEAPPADPGPVAGTGGGGAGSIAGTTGGGAAPVAGTPGGGNATTGGAAGATTMAGAGGQSMAGAAGAGGAAVGHTGPSPGCGMQSADEPRKYVQHNLTVPVAPAFQAQYTNRKYYTYLPNNYDPSKAYPLVFYGAGCGATMSEPQPAMGVFNDEAILVFLLQVESCFQAGSNGTADSPDIAYFDMALNEIENNYCINRDRVFMSGYSSGAWFSITLSCSHGDKLRGIAVAAGGQQPALPACKESTAALFFVSSNDDGNPVDGATGSGVARDRLLQANGCEMTTSDWDARWPSCKKYSGCDQDPVVFCDHMGGHTNGQNEKMANDGWWKFFTELP